MGVAINARKPATGYAGYGTPEQIRRRREIADALAAGVFNRRVADDPGEALGTGLGQIGAALAARSMNKRADKTQSEGRESAQAIMDALLGRRGATQPEREAPVSTAPAPEPASARSRDLPPGLMQAAYEVESGGDPNAVSPKGATGVGQVMPDTARDPGYGVPSIFDTARQMGREVPDESDATLQALLRDPEVNRAFSSNYMGAMHREQGGDVDRTLAAYNAGPGAVAQYGGVPPYPETREYVRDVQARMPTGAPERPAGGQSAPPTPDTRVAQAVDPVLVQALNHPFLTDGERAVVQSLIERQLAQNAPPDPTAGMREYEYARQNGYQGSFLDFVEAKRGGTNVTVNNQGETMPQVGTIPQGFELRRTETGWQMAPIPGGPAEREQQEAAEQDKQKEALKERYAGVVLDDIGRVRTRLENSVLPITGPAGAFLSAIPGTSAHDVSKLTDTIRANVGFDRLQQMRDASPTGGALGQVSELENRLLQATLGNLELSQTEDQFLENLNRLEKVYLDIIHGPGNRPEAKARGDGIPTYNPATGDFE